MTEQIGAVPGERTEARLGCRTGYYSCSLVTRIGELELRIPGDRDGYQQFGGLASWARL